MAYEHEPHESAAYQIIGGVIFGLLFVALVVVMIP